MPDDEDKVSDEELQALARKAADDPESAEQLWQALGE